jgi:hypothetical protein
MSRHIVTLVTAIYGTAFALDCPNYPAQTTKDWQVEVEGAVAKIGPVRGGEIKTQTRNATQDLLGRLPDAGKLYLEQMMFAAYCSALRDDKTISESRKAQLLREYGVEVRNVVSQQRQPSTVAKPAKPAQSPPPASPMIDAKAARFGVMLGWQLARYEFAKDSQFSEARTASIQIEQDIKALLQQDGYPRSLEDQSAGQVINGILLYYSTTNLEKHASILVGIAALRASLVGVSSTPENNEEMRRLAFSAIREIDDSVIQRKQEFFEQLLAKRPKNVPDTLSLLAGAKLR